MREIRDASATLARHGDRRFSQLLWGRLEGSLHTGAGGWFLHAGEKRIEFTAQGVKLDSVGVRQSVELAHRNQNRFRLVVFRDDDPAALHHFFQDSAEL